MGPTPYHAPYSAAAAAAAGSAGEYGVQLLPFFGLPSVLLPPSLQQQQQQQQEMLLQGFTPNSLPAIPASARIMQQQQEIGDKAGLSGSMGSYQQQQQLAAVQAAASGVGAARGAAKLRRNSSTVTTATAAAAAGAGCVKRKGPSTRFR
jgi:hypothetical protein